MALSSPRSTNENVPAAPTTEATASAGARTSYRRHHEGVKMTLRAAMLLSLLVGLLVGAAAPAAATSSGCTTANLGDVCLTVNGSGTHVDNVYIVRNKASWSGICYY